MSMAEPWFNEAAFGTWFGAGAGVVLGTAGAVLGSAAGILAPRGKGRWWLMPAFVAMVLLGLASLGFGLVALVSGQPYGIWFGPTWAGILSAGLFGMGIGVLRHRYAAAEQRRLEAEALRHG